MVRTIDTSSTARVWISTLLYALGAKYFSLKHFHLVPSFKLGVYRFHYLHAIFRLLGIYAPYVYVVLYAECVLSLCMWLSFQVLTRRMEVMVMSVPSTRAVPR